MDEKFKVIKKFGSLSEDTSNWHTEFRLVSFADLTGTVWGEPKFDIRHWKQNIPGAGIRFTREELITLRNLIDTALSDEDK